MLFDYEAVQDKELTLQKGDGVFVFRTYSDDWVYVENDSRVGLAPLAYLRCAEEKT